MEYFTEVDGQIAYPIGDGGMKNCIAQIDCLEKALLILKNDKS